MRWPQPWRPRRASGQLPHIPEVSRAPRVAAFLDYASAIDFYQRYRPDTNARAIALFRRAFERDAGFAPAHAGLADAYARRAAVDDRDPKWASAALAAADRAVLIDPELPSAHKARGFALAVQGRRDEALPAYRRALELKLPR